MATNRSIIILTPGFASSEDDESCLPMHQSFVRTVSDEFPDLKIIVLAFQYPFRADVYSFYQATVHSFNGRNRGALTKYFLRRKIFKRLATIHSTENIMGVVSFWYGECAFVGKKFCSKNNIPHMCWLLGQDAKKGNKYFRRAPLSANQLIALSDFIQKTVEENYLIRPFKVIAPGINPKHLPLLNLEKDIDIIGVGSLISLKQYNVFLEVIAEIKKQKKNIDVVLIGEGIEKKELINQSENLSLNNNVKLPGALSHKETMLYMQRSKILLHTSSYEAFGVVCLEALYNGAKVISFVKPMEADIPNWYIVETKEQMIETAVTLLNDNSVQYYSQTVYKMEDTVAEMVKLFE